MSDTYQAVYDAVRSRLSNCDVGRAIQEGMSLDGSHAIEMVRQTWQEVAHVFTLPSILYRPRIMIDGDKWCALYGDNLQDGVAGFGDSPEEAMADFNHVWRTALRAQSAVAHPSSPRTQE